MRITMIILLFFLSEGYAADVAADIGMSSLRSNNNNNNKDKNHHRQAQQRSTSTVAFDKIFDYQPQSDVRDPLRLDLDQDILERFLASDDFDSAMMVYNQGAHSQSFAQLIIDPLILFVPKGSKLRVTTSSGTVINGLSLESSLVHQTYIRFLYNPDSGDDSGKGDCIVGGLPAAHQATSGCLPAEGELQIQGQTERSYAYDPATDNRNGRTLAGFSTDAKAELHDCGESCPRATYQKFVNYYDRFDYGDVFVNAGASGVKTEGLRSGVMDFSMYNRMGQAEIVKKAAVYMNVWMYVIGEMEDALDACEGGTDSVSAWDEAVALYTGSMEGTASAAPGMPNEGILLFGLANKRCENFRTCGEDQNQATGTAKVNIEVFRYFKAGQNDLNLGNCASARKQKEEIEKLMIVPLIQGTLRNAWINDVESETAGDRESAEGAIFAASLLPLLHDCDAGDAEFLYHRMKPGAQVPDFPGVKGALERNYKCLGVTCDMVGGLYDSQILRYAPFAGPCGGGNRTATTVGIVLGVLAGILIIIICRILGKRRMKEDAFFSRGELSIDADGVVRNVEEFVRYETSSDMNGAASSAADISENCAGSDSGAITETTVINPGVEAAEEEVKDLPPIA